MMAFLYSRFNSSFGFSAEEMLEISRDINQKFTPRQPNQSSRLRSTLQAKDLLAISEEITREFSPSPAVETSQLVILPVDPEHLYAYWHVHESDLPNTAASVAEPLMLRVYAELNPNHQECPQASSWFDIPLAQPHMQQTVKINGTDKIAAFSAAIGRTEKGKTDSLEHFVPIIRSNNIKVPRAIASDADLQAADGLAGKVSSQSGMTHLSNPFSSQGHYK